MTSICDDILYLTRQYKKQCDKLLLPLRQLGITLFTFQRVTYDGYWSLFCSDVGAMEYSVENKLYRYDPTLIDPHQYKSGVNYLNTHDNKEFQDNMLADVTNKFSIHHPLVITNINSTGCEYIFFATSKNNFRIINTYISKMHYLKNFITYFKNATEWLFRDSMNHQVDLKLINKTNFYSNKNKLTIYDFTQQTNSLNKLPNSITSILSQREQECLNNFLDGMTAKETAAILGISHRTIEEYFANIKKKLKCKNKRDLYKFNDDAGLSL